MFSNSARIAALYISLALSNSFAFCKSTAALNKSRGSVLFAVALSAKELSDKRKAAAKKNTAAFPTKTLRDNFAKSFLVPIRLSSESNTRAAAKNIWKRSIAVCLILDSNSLFGISFRRDTAFSMPLSVRDA